MINNYFSIHKSRLLFESTQVTLKIISFLKQLQCCGAQEYMDWKNTTFGGAGDVPDSCCITDAHACGKGVLNEDTVNWFILAEELQ